VSALSGKQRRFLRGKGHALSSTVQIGKEGVTDAVVSAVEAALGDHELIKVKLVPGASVERHEAAAELARRTASELVQVLGNTMLLYKRNEDDPEIELPA
jgi:RNA-binding protein